MKAKLLGGTREHPVPGISLHRATIELSRADSNSVVLVVAVLVAVVAATCALSHFLTTGRLSSVAPKINGSKPFRHFLSFVSLSKRHRDGILNRISHLAEAPERDRVVLSSRSFLYKSHLQQMVRSFGRSSTFPLHRVPVHRTGVTGELSARPNCR